MSHSFKYLKHASGFRTWSIMCLWNSRVIAFISEGSKKMLFLSVVLDIVISIVHIFQVAAPVCQILIPSKSFHKENLHTLQFKETHRIWISIAKYYVEAKYIEGWFLS